MKGRIAGSLLPCYRPGKKLDPKIIKAARLAEQDDELAQVLSDQMDFDEQIVQAIYSIKPPENLRQKIEEISTGSGAPRRRKRRHLLNPAVLAVLIGVVLIIGFLIHLELENRADFPGRGVVVRMLDLAEEMNGSEFATRDDPLPAGQFGDTLYMSGFEGFAVPPEFAKLPVVGWRVYKLQGHRVAQLAVEENDSLLFVFRASDFGVQPGAEDQRRIVSHGEWIGSVQERQGLCTMIAFRGSKAEMQQFLDSLKP